MNAEIIKEENRWLLEAIGEQYEALMRHGDRPPRIEYDILMDNVRKFYENLHRLQRMSESPFPAETKAAPLEQPAEQPAVRPAEPPPPSPVTEPMELPPPAPVQFRPSPPAPAKQENTGAARKTAKPADMDLFAGEEPAFSIKLREAREKTFGPKIPSGHIDNLKAAININEKFMFINELFDGSLREYNETIDTLNGFQSLDQAADYLDLMRKKNFWNTGSGAFRRLKELVEQRF